jgi:uncharacterized membrane protein YdbT with pleckstrin-like domain
MALVDCPECARSVSDQAASCPSCGFPLPPLEPIQVHDPPLFVLHPSWWAYAWSVVFFWLVLPPLVAWIVRRSTVLRIFRLRVTMERGVFSKSYREFLIADIRSVDIDQTFLERIVGIGTLTFSTAATVDAAEAVRGLSRPKRVREQLLRRHA